ncbi:DNA-binding response regulator [Pseudomonas aeruginosa]|nr:DNA-binding response regulator [Pseudomonas aeruginosa]
MDDDPTFTRVLARAMSRRGLRVSTAGSAEEGLALAQQDTPDYAVLDLKMEGDSGLVLLPKLLELHADMRVVILHRLFQHRHRGGRRSSAAPATTCASRRMPMTCWPRCSPSTPDLDTLVPENPMSVDRLQWEHIQRVLAEHEGNISATARALGMHRRTLQRKLQKRPVRR